MDFLEIRRKAKERARARAAEEGRRAPEEAGPGPEGPGESASGPRGRGHVAASPEAPDRRRGEGAARGGGPAAHPDLVGRAAAQGLAGGEVDRIGGGDLPVAERLQALPPVGGEGPDAVGEAVEEGFTTWRPGDGAPPFLPPPVVRPVSPPHDEDFKVIVPGACGSDAAPPARSARPVLDPLDEFFFRPDEAAPEMPDIEAPGEAAREEGPALVREEYLTFLLGAEEYAVAVAQVREVIRAPPVTEVPRAPAHVLGVVTVRGEVVAVIDPRRRLGLPARPPREGEGKIVIVDPGDVPCGLLVDRVAHVVRLAPGRIEPCPQGIARHGADCLAGIGREGERIFTVLDLGALLRRADAGGEGAPAPRRADASA